MTGSPRTAYLAAEGRLDELLHDLAAVPVAAVHGRLVVTAAAPVPAPWARNVWHDATEHPVASIGAAARTLRDIQRNWALYSAGWHRRAALIQEKLPPVSARPLVFPQPAPSAPLGSWTLLAPDRMLVAPRCSSPFPNGEIRFVEDRTGPPNRAYLKLWEALTRLGRHPQPGETCLDLGASPGGWTWVLAGLGARVIAVDKAPLDPAIAALPGVETRRESAFGLDPGALPPVDWVFSDVICYPDRLYGLVRRWLDARACRRLVCSVKFQGITDHAAVARFAALPGATLAHLVHNKHELTLFVEAIGR